MNLGFKHFQKEWYPQYLAWFDDPELNRRLGPMDVEWLDAVLAMTEAEGEVWAVFRVNEMVAVIETVFHPQDVQPVGITAIAVKPYLRGQGVGSAALQHLLAWHHSKGLYKHLAYIHKDNCAARNLIEKFGFKAVTELPDNHGYIEFRLFNSDTR